MILGTLNRRSEAIVPLRLRGPTGAELDVDAVLDSGFSGALTLPPAKVAVLGLRWRSEIDSVLADGTVVRFDCYDVEVDWDGVWRPVIVSAVGNETLLGMRLLADHVVRFEVVPGGFVEITSLP